MSRGDLVLGVVFGGLSSEAAVDDIFQDLRSISQILIRTHPMTYGCLPLDEYFWFNSGHITSHVHQILADATENYLEAEL